MKNLATIPILGCAAIASAYAVPESTGHVEQRDFQAVHLLFLGGPESYTLTIAADGVEYFTSMWLPPLLETQPYLRALMYLGSR